MILDMDDFKSRYYSSGKAILPLMNFRISMLKYFFQKNKYPLFYVSASRGGIIRTNEIQKKLKLCKFTKFASHYYFSLTIPHWPSKAFDNMVAGGGLNITAAGTAAKKQIDTVIMGITRQCNYKCCHCYEHYNLGDIDTVPLGKWTNTVKEFQKAGVNIRYARSKTDIRYTSWKLGH
jgi:hypothetical protein